MWRYLLVALLVMVAAAIAVAERVPNNPQYSCAATGRCGNISSTQPTIVQPPRGDLPDITCTLPKELPCQL